MSGRIKGITIEIDGNTTGLQKALSGVDKSLRDTQKNLRDVNKLLKLNPGNVTLLKQKQDLLKKAIQDTKEKLDKEKEALAQLAAADQTPEVKAQMEALQREIIEDENKLKDLKKEFGSFGSVAGQKIQSVGQSIKAVGDKVKEVGEKISSVGQSITTKLTVPLTAVGAASIKAFSDVDKGMDTIIAKTGATGEAAEEMGEILEEVATSIPTDFETAGAAIGEVNTRFGVTGTELETLSAKFIKFAQLNEVDVTTAIDNTQSAMAAFGLSADDAGGFLDTLNKAGQDTGVSVDKLAGDLTTNAAALKEMGFSASDAVFFIANLDKSGVDASSTMSGLKKALANASKEGKPMSEALGEIQDSIKNAKTDQEAYQAAIDLFGTKAGPAIAEACRSGRLSFDELGTSLTDNVGNIETTFEETQDPIDKFKITLNQLKIVGAEIGNTLATILAPALDKLKNGLQSIKDKWDELDPGTQDMIVKIGMIVAAVGPLVMIIGGVVSAIGSIIGVIGGLVSAIGLVVGVLGGPLTLVIAGAVAAGILLYQNWDKIKAKAIEIKNKVTEAFSNLKTTIVTKWNEIKTNTLAAWENVKTTITTKVSDAVTAVKSKFEAIKTKITTTYTNIKTATTTAWNNIKTTFTDKIDAIKTAVTTKFEAIKDKIKEKINDAKDAVKTAIDKIKGFFNFEWKIPRPKLPKFSLKTASKTVFGQTLTYPTGISFDGWYRKAYDTPYLFTDPTIVNGRGYGDGPGGEIVYGHQQLMDDISKATGINANKIYQAVKEGASDSTPIVVIGERELGRALREMGVIFG